MNCIYIRRCFNICEVFSDIKKWYHLFELLTSKQFYIKKQFLISKNFLTSSNYFLISEIRILYEKLFYEIRQIYLLILWIKGNFFIWKKNSNTWYQDIIFWYPKIIFILWYQIIDFWYQKKHRITINSMNVPCDATL